jgi:methylmalonyl-CoA mutase cobalamin-binding subunit
MKESEKFRQACKEAGVKPATVLRLANIPAETLANWRKKNPKSFDTRDKMYNTLQDMKNEILARSEA